jgi:rhodanese-related sulfurtransferase
VSQLAQAGPDRAQLGIRTQVVDVRSVSEFASGHVPGAVNIPMEEVESRLGDVERDRRVIVVCQSGKRAELVAKMLEPCGMDVAVLEGGTAAWRKQGLPLVTSVKTRWSLERQVRLGAGLLVLTGIVLAITANVKWIVLSGFVGLGLSFAGITDLCPMAMLLGKMPWNRTSQCGVPAENSQGGR